MGGTLWRSCLHESFTANANKTHTQEVLVYSLLVSSIFFSFCFSYRLVSAWGGAL